MSLPVLDLIEQLERRAGSANIALLRPRRHDWQLVIFREADAVCRDVYLSYHGDTCGDVVHQALDDVQADLRAAA